MVGDDAALAAARRFIEEFDRYFGNGGAGPAHPKFFDAAYYALRAALAAVGHAPERNAPHPERVAAEELVVIFDPLPIAHRNCE